MQNTLASWYLASLSAHADGLEEAMTRLQSSGDEAPLRRLAHRLRGSGGSYGFPEITEAATAVEDAVEGGVRTPTEELVELLRSLGPDSADGSTSILIVDDDPAVLALLSARLERPDRPVLTASTSEQAHSLLRDHPIGLVLLDLCLERTDGRDFLAALRAGRGTADVPVAVLSVLDDERTKAECYGLGADAYFVKPVDPETLAAAAESLIGRWVRARATARTDLLTGLRNRRGLEEEYLRLRAQAGRSGRRLAVAVLDFDRFKAINAPWGLAGGDEVLLRGADAHSTGLRGSDLLGRWGGEEFVVLLPDTDLDGAIRALTGALQALRSTPIQVGSARIEGVSFSGGVVEVESEAELDQVVREADAALYVAKASGRGRIVGPDAELVDALGHVLVVEDDPAALRQIFACLVQEGIRVTAATDLRSARQRLRGGSFDLILLDRVLPDGDGLDLVAEARGAPGARGVPMLVLTALTDEDELARSFRAGVDDYVVKPWSPVELASRVRRILIRNSAQPERKTGRE